ncbi:PTS sugar transporter subunit IIC [Solobacterium moorei]|uniref:Permease IIC component n=2 Tax=Solobacterium moorei TaxID=102148 RepID=A0A412PDA1_9FIRM|nr:PTS sugar transporter subunit IIC [Solobacterium moorei]
MKWMIEKFAPAMTKFVAIPWVACIANTFTRLLPVILTGSLIFFYNVFRSYIPALPNLDPVKDFSFGFLSLFIAFMIPYNLLELKDCKKNMVLGGLIGAAAFCLVLNPVIDKNYFMNINYSYFGPTGTFVAMVVGEVVAVIYYNWVRFHFFENSDKVPDFIVDWLNNIAPIFLILLFGYILIGVLGVDIVDVLSTIFSPISAISNTYIGFVLLILIPTILYSLGISSWAFGAVSNPIYFANIAANIAAVEAGGKALSIATSEATFTAALITLGGMGCTLVLVIMAALKGKSKKMKAMGRICLVPSIFNINEPVVYGFPIVFNPILMVPFWLCSIVGASIEYFVMKLGWLNIPSKMIQVGQIPAPFSSIMITEDMRAIIWWVVLLIVYWLIYWPFFKAYDKECLKQEAIEETGE